MYLYLDGDDTIDAGESRAANLGLRQSDYPLDCPQHPELVLLTLTIPLWTFVTMYLLIALIHYLRRAQYFILYDKCTYKNAHFRYDFHLVIGRYSNNYNKIDSHLIVDLLDSQLISTMTLQVPGSTIFNDNQPFMYRHSRPDLRCVSFSIYRRHPLKDVKCIRIAHGCVNSESRLFVYGLNLVDVTNGENKFFPVTSVVKYRGTQWALTTSFEPKNDTSFSKLGCACYDPFETSRWPTYMELLILIFYIWSAVLCFGSLISITAILNSVTLHALTVSFIVGSSAVVLGFVYLRFLKQHIVDTHYDSSIWCILAHLFLAIITGLSLVFWSIALKKESCAASASEWAKSSISSATILSFLILTAYYVAQRRRTSNDSTTLEAYENNLIKTNSRNNVDFVRETGGLNCNLFRTQPNPPTVLPMTSKKTVKAAKPANSGSRDKKGSVNKAGKPNSGKKKDNEETLDNAFNSDNNAYIKTKNRNSISQYV